MICGGASPVQNVESEVNGKSDRFARPVPGGAFSLVTGHNAARLARLAFLALAKLDEIAKALQDDARCPMFGPLVVDELLAARGGCERIREPLPECLGWNGRPVGVRIMVESFRHKHACGIRFAVARLAQIADMAVLDAKAGALRVCLGRRLAGPACIDINSHTRMCE
jgi:hypothetical protein